MKSITLALVAVLLVGVALGKPQGNPNNCDNWCQNSLGQYTCCNKLPQCPGACTLLPAPRCNNDSSCGPGGICCMDRCLRYTVCLYR